MLTGGGALLTGLDAAPRARDRHAHPHRGEPAAVGGDRLGSGPGGVRRAAGRAVPWPGSLTGWGPRSAHVVIPSFLQGRRGIIAALVVTSLVLITLDLPRQQHDRRRAQRVGRPHRADPGRDRARSSRRSRRAWHGIVDYESVKEENDRLREQRRGAGGRLDRVGGPDPRLRGAAGLQQPAGALRHPRGGRRGDRRPASELRAADDRDQPGLEQGHPGRHGRSSPPPAWWGGSCG